MTDDQTSLGRVPGRDDFRQFRRLLVFIRPYRKHFTIAMVGVLVSSGLGLVFPRIMGSLVDSALLPSIGDSASRLDSIALLLLGVFLAQGAFNYLRIYFLSAMGEGIVADLRSHVYAHIMTLPVKFFDSRKTGEITSRLTSDVSVVQSTVSSSLASAISQAITLIGGLVLMFVASVTLSALVLSFLPITIVAAAIFGRRLRRISRDYQDKVADANASAEEAIAANRVVKWFTAEETEIHRYVSKVQESYRVALRRARLRALFSPFVQFVGYGTIALVMWIGGRQVLDGSLTAGELVTFLLYTLTVAGAIGAFTGLYGSLQEALGASQRIFELLGEQSGIEDPLTPITLAAVEGRIAFEGVGFRYSDRDIDVLVSMNLEVAPGEVVALVGPSGAGKSTIVQLIPRFFDPTSGRILIDGVDLRDLRLRDLRSHMAAVPQETQLFSGTIMENLLMGKPDASPAEVQAAAAAANAHDFIETFPSGYDTIVGERGVKLSGGQRQRVAIARALLNDPRILILDEATSSLDSESEATVQEALDHLMEGRTTLVIAHRLSTVRNADRLAVIDEGRIVQEGNHEELLAQGGLYADLYHLQFRDGSEPPAI
ncbi:MAG: ABC transporter ATP-binding protein/permease [Acidimicrobiia bacterium]|nr:ABC transporter ATP-binding protein/permease [Acidimicrobiia bacterium]